MVMAASKLNIDCRSIELKSDRLAEQQLNSWTIPGTNKRAFWCDAFLYLHILDHSAFPNAEKTLYLLPTFQPCLGIITELLQSFKSMIDKSSS